MRYRLGIMPFGRTFTVPCGAAEYLRLADANFCKALLAMLCTDVPFVDTDELAQRCNMTPADAEDAVAFWADKGVITISSADTAEAVAASAPVSAPAVSQEGPSVRVCVTDAVDPMKKTAASKSPVRYSPKDLANKIQMDKELRSLFNEVEKIFGRPVNSTETSGFVNLYEYYGYSAPSILMICQFAHDLGKDRIAYIEQVARDWYSRGITEYPQIEQEIIRQTALNSLHGKIKSVLGIECELTKRQKEYFDSWIDWGFDSDTIRLAGERCREKKNAVDIKYINGILTRWHKDDLMSVDAVLTSEQAFADKKRTDADSSSFDAESWEDMARNFDPDMLLNEENM